MGVEDSPRTLMECERRVASEEACRAYVVQLRWPEGVRGLRCHSPSVWATARGLSHGPCCGFQTSVLAGTLFQDTQAPLRLWCRAMWDVTHQQAGVRALGLQRGVGLGSSRTAWSGLQQRRTAMVRPGRERRTGTVEVDATSLGGPTPGQPGRGAAGQTVLVVAAQVDGPRVGRLRLRRVPDASARSLERAVPEAIEPGSVVRTEGWPGDSRLAARG